MCVYPCRAENGQSVILSLPKQEYTNHAWVIYSNNTVFTSQVKDWFFGVPLSEEDREIFYLESLILAQNERWRRGSGMQVERFRKE